jgi:hypothetical protein
MCIISRHMKNRTEGVQEGISGGHFRREKISEENNSRHRVA